MTTKNIYKSTAAYCWHEAWELLFLLLLYLALCAAMFLALGLLAGKSHANETAAELSQLEHVSQGSLLFSQENGLFHPAAVLNTEVNIDVSGMVARVSVQQKFKNNQDTWGEAVYVFPLPEDVAVDQMRMQIGERFIEGQIKERKQAKRTYDQARQAGKKAALIEQERPNLFTNSVANIAPHEDVIVEIEYQQVLRYDAGRFRLRFPMAVTPRYIPGNIVQQRETINHFNGQGWASGTDEVPDAARITPPVWGGEGKINPISLTIRLNAGFPVAKLQSLYHDIKTTHNSDVTTITLTHQQTYSDKDFELVWQAEAGHAPRAALFSEQVGAEFYHLLMVLPPQSGEDQQQRLSREAIYIIDSSGSMGGASIQQAKQALLFALERLHADDSFNIIAFNSYAQQLFSSAQPASPDNLQRAQNYVKSLQANGGTNMRPALELAFNAQTEGQALRQVVFLTDGSVGNEAALFSLIKQRLGASRLFTIGIGAAPNSHFMSKAAQFGRGSYTYIGDLDEVKIKMSDLFQKLETPLMSNLIADFGNADIEFYPERLPDLYHGEPLIISARTDINTQTVLVSGQRQHSAWQNTIALGHGLTGQGIGKLWARKKIADLMDKQYEAADKEPIRQQIIDVALQHHLVSKYTSLVAVDVTPSRPHVQPLQQQALPLNLPHGQVHEKIFGLHTQTASAAPLHLTLGVTLLLLTLLLKPRRTKART